MKPKKPITEWKNIFLDTSFIIDYFTYGKSDIKDQLTKERRELVNSVMEILSNYDLEGGNQKRNFYISSLSVTELRKLEKDNVAKELVRIFSASDVTFVDYTKNIALVLNRSLETHLPEGQKHQFLSYLEKELKYSNVVSARQWVTMDLMIAGSAKSVKNLDVVLTSDKKTFKLIADTLDLPCLAMFKEEIDFDLFGKISVSKSK